MKRYFKYITPAVLFVILCIVFSLTDKFAFCYLEDTGTFFYERGYLLGNLFRIGGVATLAAQFIVQFFVTPWSGIVLASASLTFAAWLGAKVIDKINPSFRALAVLPVIAFVPLMMDFNFLFSALTSYLIAVSCLLPPRSKHGWPEALIAFVMYFLVGPVAVLYALAAIVLRAFDSPNMIWKGLFAIAAVAVAVLLAFSLGLMSTFDRALGPGHYSMIKGKVALFVYWPWILCLAAYVIAGLVKAKPLACRLASGVAAAALLFVFLKAGTAPDNWYIKELSYYAGKEQWKEMLATSKGHRTNNTVYQNYLNMAYAQRGVLIDRAASIGTSSPEGLFMQANRISLLGLMESDVNYYAGLLAASQRHAFESNQSFGGYSPRLLKRLVQTNTVYDYDAVADKYRRLLDKTLFHKSSKIKLPELVPPATDTFTGLFGPDQDLFQVLLANRSYSPAFQYLCIIRMMNGNQSTLPGLVGMFPDAIPHPYPSNLKKWLK